MHKGDVGNTLIGFDSGKGGVGGQAPHLRRPGYKGGVGAKPPPKKGGLGGKAPSLELTNFCDNFSYVFCCLCCSPSVYYQIPNSPFFETCPAILFVVISGFIVVLGKYLMKFWDFKVFSCISS